VKLPLRRVAEFTSATGSFDGETVAAGYSIDSRTIAAGELFIAIKGERLDGHDFVPQALEHGAVAAIVSKEHAPRCPDQSKLLVVPDTLLALHKLGAAVRRLWGKPLIGVTGSAGKTTTKETIAHVLARKFRVLKSEGNLNNQFGLPLQLLRLEPEHELAVIELGMSHAGEITELARLARPDIGVVTNVAPVHLEFFDSLAGIARAKYELIQSLPPHGVAVLNADDEYVSQFGRDFHGKVVTFAIAHPADIRAENIRDLGADGCAFDIVGCGERRQPAVVPLVGRHNLYNALAAVAVACERGMPLADAAAALAELKPADKRGEVLKLAGATVINDCYNSNPKALNAMVDALAQMPAARRIVVAGEMLELGPTAADLHRRAGAYMAARGIDVVIGVRGHAEHIVDAAKQAGIEAVFVATPEEAGAWMASQVRPGDAVLLKASRGVKLEKALETWRSKLATAAAQRR
jgi:UDP-N-acetylmuramoyl-tripeptide--D-alanyl-D-alanine ligase